MPGFQQKSYCAAGTIHENRMEKCPLISSKSLSKTERGTSDALFDKINKTAVVH